MNKSYSITEVDLTPSYSELLSRELWENISSLEICEFRKESSEHRPKTTCQLLYTANGIYGLFNVEDQYVKAIHSGFQVPVCEDSCVEFFVKPESAKGYFNFEFNACGAILASYITNHKRTPEGFEGFTMLKLEDLQRIQAEPSIPSPVLEEITDPLTWSLAFFIPFDIFAKYANGFKLPEHGTSWKANFYKCGDKTSHPHWAAWSPVKELNFHLPECFGTIEFLENR